MAYQYADIIIDISHEKVDRPFQYRIPTHLAEEITAGTCVTVPFGRVIHFGLDMWWEWEIRRSMTHPASRR